MKLRPCEDGRFAFRPGRGLSLDGDHLPGGLIGHMMMGAIMSAGGALVSYDRLIALTGTTATDKRTVLRVALTRMRKQAAARGAMLPVETIMGQGLRWITAANEQKEAA